MNTRRVRPIPVGVSTVTHIGVPLSPTAYISLTSPSLRPSWSRTVSPGRLLTSSIADAVAMLPPSVAARIALPVSARDLTHGPRGALSPNPEHGAHRLGQHPEPLGVGGPLPRDQRHLEQLGLVPGGERGRASEQLDRL